MTKAGLLVVEYEEIKKAQDERSYLLNPSNFTKPLSIKLPRA